MKKQNHTAMVLLLGGIVVAGIFLTSLVPVNNDESKLKPQQKHEDTERATLEKTLQQYLHNLSETSDWWMISTPPPTPETARNLVMALSNVSNALASARGASPLTEEIARNFNQFFTSVFENGVSRVTQEGYIDVEL